MAQIIVEESFDPPLSEEIYKHLTDKLAPCLEMREARWVSSHMAADRTRCICIYDARDAQAVRDAYQLAGFKYDRVWTTARWEPKA